MALSRLHTRYLGAACLLGFVAFLFYWVQVRAGKELDVVYDLSRMGRTDLVRLRVEIRRGAELVRDAEFHYPAGEGRAPPQQRHRLKLGEGSYVAHFQLRFSHAAAMARVTPFEVTGTEPVIIPVPSAQ